MIAVQERKSISKIWRYLSISIFIITISSISSSTVLPLNSTTLWWICDGFVLFTFWKARVLVSDYQNIKTTRFVKWYLIWNIICITRGLFVADNYWEWKNLVGMGMVLMLPLACLIFTSPLAVQRIATFWFTYFLPAFFALVLTFKNSDTTGRYLAPVSFLLLFFPILNKKWKLIILFFSCLVFFSDLNARSNVIKFSVPILLSAVYYLRKFISSNILEIFRLIIIVTPMVLCTLAITNVFNIFKMEDYITADYTTQIVSGGEVKEVSLKTDTRTAIYYEVLNSAVKHKYIWFGRTPARGNDSRIFGQIVKEELNTGKMERFANEVSILNIFTWTGLTGVILYMLIFFSASYLAINKSNNQLIKVVGLYVAFRWAYAWVEDFNNFDLSYLFLWVMIGMCLSPAFRSLDNLQMKYWILGIFDPRYQRKAYEYNLLLLEKRQAKKSLEIAM